MSKKILAVFFSLWATVGSADTTVIAALGDSLTHGYGLPVDQGLVPQLENWLVEQGSDVRVINAGVSGDTTAGGVARIDWTLTDDVDVLMVALGGNDLLRGLPVESSHANLAHILRVAAEQDVQIAVVEMVAPGNYGPDYKQAFDTMYSELAAEFGANVIPPFFQGISADISDVGALQPFMQADGIHPNAKGVSLIVEFIGPMLQSMLPD